MAGLLPIEGDFRARPEEERGEARGLVSRHHFIVAARDDQHRHVAKVRRVRRVERNHGAQKDGAGQNTGAEQEHRGGDVGAVGIADGDDLPEMMAFALVFDEIGQLMRAPDEIGFVENPGSQTTEEAELSVFVDFAARAEQRGFGADQLSQRDQVVFVAAGAVQQ